MNGARKADLVVQDPEIATFAPRYLQQVETKRGRRRVSSSKDASRSARVSAVIAGPSSCRLVTAPRIEAASLRSWDNEDRQYGAQPLPFDLAPRATYSSRAARVPERWPRHGA